MPIYEYRCENCGHTLDALQKVADDPLKDCPQCESRGLRRLVSAPAFRLKGSGWYETDFKSDKEKRRNLAESPEPAKERKSKDGKDGKDGKDAGAGKPAEKKSSDAAATGGKGPPGKSSGGDKAGAST